MARKNKRATTKKIIDATTKKVNAETGKLIITVDDAPTLKQPEHYTKAFA